MENYKDILYAERPLSGKPRMVVSHRAKQFAPFAALKGFEECVKKKEIIYIERPVLAEEQKDLIDLQLRQIEYGKEIRVVYFEDCLYMPGKGIKRIQEGTVKLLKPLRYIQVNSVRIEINNILEIVVIHREDT